MKSATIRSGDDGYKSEALSVGAYGFIAKPFSEKDLKKMFPGTKGFSSTNLRYMKRYYNLFGEILPQVEAELSEESNLPQLGAEIYTVPWGHIKVIVDKCKDNPEKALFLLMR